jgi:hypothetical protein
MLGPSLRQVSAPAFVPVLSTHKTQLLNVSPEEPE